PERVHRDEWRQLARVAEVVREKAARQRRTRCGLTREHVDLAAGDLLAVNGNARPAKFEPPPTQPITTSGKAPAISICAIASWPITVWCRRTWLRTLPSE